MAYLHDFNIDTLKVNFNSIITLDTEILEKREAISKNLDDLKSTYNSLIKENNKKLFLFCLDSFYFQYRIMAIELENYSKIITLINNRMYGEYYKLYNIILLQLKERNINIASILSEKKYPIYKDLEQFREYHPNDINNIHDSILVIINELYSIRW